MNKNGWAKYLMGGSTALNLFGDVADAESAWAAARYNSRAAKGEARQVEEAGALDVRQFERAGRSKIGSDLAAIAASNTAFSGSAVDIMADTAAQLALEKMNRERQTRLRANALRDESRNALQTGAARRASGYLKASGRLLTSTNDLLSML